MDIIIKTSTANSKIISQGNQVTLDSLRITILIVWDAQKKSYQTLEIEVIKIIVT